MPPAAERLAVNTGTMALIAAAGALALTVLAFGSVARLRRR